MAHRTTRRKLGRATDQRMALLRSLISALLWHGKIVTTEAKAKEAKSIAERLITLARTDTAANRRQARQILYPVKTTYTVQRSEGDPVEVKRRRNKPGSVDTAISRLFNEIGPQYEERQGGYVRMVRLGAIPPREGSLRTSRAARRGDGAVMVKLELVDYVPPAAA
ncbi:MAG: 50S ribosomal protein L17 [Armatimonadetes bacterium]|nr:50S ribosomal protein L17 [Armatimonadota bacterium]NIM23654.1 50S ribosomal protein L17 [Armatimonadota bacterium]NIM67524.1 50S ribosomal protein L17 [Armatimonadota bacterium]NIM76046.1 50S ribosomal protein L17 [Armatimonadota bacterium]NIN05710.1 50S ribosomal protein L17 [Armatimonadota bacterium]